jgi:hypothetical protein
VALTTERVVAEVLTGLQRRRAPRGVVERLFDMLGEEGEPVGFLTTGEEVFGPRSRASAALTRASSP